MGRLARLDQPVGLYQFCSETKKAAFWAGRTQRARTWSPAAISVATRNRPASLDHQAASLLPELRGVLLTLARHRDNLSQDQRFYKYGGHCQEI